MLATLIAYLYVLSFVKIKYKFVIVKYFCGEHSAKNTTVNSQCAEMLRGKTRLGKHPDKENYITAMIGANTNTKSNQMKSRRVFAIVSITGLY